MRGSANFAPLKPLQSLGQKDAKSHYVCDALKERFQHYIKYEETTRRDLLAGGELLAKFLQGDQILKRNPFDSGYLVIRPKRKDGSEKRALNLTQYYISRILEKLNSSEPDISVKPATDSESDRLTAKGCNTIVDFYESRWYPAGIARVREELHRLVWGNSIHRIRHDAQAQGVQVLRDIVDQVPVQLGVGAGYCGECEHVGGAGEFMSEAGEFACPKCGSNAVNVEQPAQEMMPSVVGQEAVNLGELVLDHLEIPGCWWDLRVEPEDSRWFIYQRRVGLAQVRSLLGSVTLADSDDDIGLQTIERLSYLGQAIDGAAKARGGTWINKEQVTISEMWLPPEDLFDIKVKGNEETVGGQAFEEGQTLGDLFPNGCVAVGLNGFKHVVGLYAENHQEHISSAPYFMRPNSGFGRGAVDIVEVQRRFNRLDSQQLDYMDAAATPATIYDPEIINADDTEYIGKAKANIPANLRLLPENRGLDDAIKQLTPQSAPGSMVQYTQMFLAKAFSTISHATDVDQGGMMGVGDRTAREAMIVDANANSIFSPMLLAKAGQRQRNAELLLPLYRKHFPIERRFPLSGKYGRMQGVSVAAADLQGQVTFEIVPGSQLPQNTIVKQARTTEFFGLFGGIPPYLQAKAQAPEMIATLEKLYNVQTDERGYDVVATVCERRMEILRQVSSLPGFDWETLQAALDAPMNPQSDVLIQLATQQMSQLMGSSAIVPEEPDHAPKMYWFSLWLDEDEGQEAPIQLRLLVRLLIRIHLQNDGTQKAAFAVQGAALNQIANPQPEMGAAGQKLGQSKPNQPNNKPAATAKAA